jgi:hypothetical protein
MYRREPSKMTGRALVATVIGFLLHLAVGFWILVGGLIMPLWAVGAMEVLWVMALVLAIRWRHRPVHVLAVPLGTLAIWFLVAWAGETWLGWTA